MKFQLLFSIPSPLEWTTSQVANIISLVGAIATVWTLIYAIRQGIKNSREINQLAEQNKLIIEQINLQKKVMKRDALPDLSLKNIHTFTDTPDVLQLEVKNEGKAATIKEVIVLSKNFKSKRELKNSVMKEDDEWRINLQRIDSTLLDEIKWHIFIAYEDFYGNQYGLEVKGTGKKWETPSKIIVE